LPSTSPLFPYTTLFRSRRCSSGSCEGEEVVEHDSFSQKQTGRSVCFGRPARMSTGRGHFFRPVALSAGGHSSKSEKAKSSSERADRKSTRLNSSHLVIS